MLIVLDTQIYYLDESIGDKYRTSVAEAVKAGIGPITTNGRRYIKTATEVGVRAIQDHKVIEWNTCWKCRLSEGTDDM